MQRFSEADNPFSEALKNDRLNKFINGGMRSLPMAAGSQAPAVAVAAWNAQKLAGSGIGSPASF